METLQLNWKNQLENRSILFLLLLHVLKFKSCLIHIFITYTLITWFVSNLTIFWLCAMVLTWVCMLVFPEARTMGVCSRFLTHLECMLSVVVKTQTTRVHAHTHIIWHPLSALCLQLPDVGCSPTVLTITLWIFICEIWHDFFQINRSIKLEEHIYKFARLEFHKF